MTSPGSRIAAPRLAALAMIAMPVLAGPAVAGTYLFVNTRSQQQIRVDCPSDPARQSRSWWQKNCRPMEDSLAAAWAAAGSTNHPDFIWLPVQPSN